MMIRSLRRPLRNLGRRIGMPDRPVPDERPGSRRFRLLVERLEDRLAPAGIVNGDFAISDPTDPGFGFTELGDAVVTNGEGVLNEGTTVQSSFSQTFTVMPG